MIARRGGFELIVVVTLLLSGCGKAEPDNVLRYKMTVEVETPEGLRSGFAIREMTLSTDNIMRPTTGRIKGEAVAVDLPGGKTLFALMTGGDGDVDYAMQIGGRAEVWGKSPDAPRMTPVELYPAAPQTAGLTNANPLPMLVTFRHIKDPKSVKRVEPEALEEEFGAGVKLKRITVINTNEEVTVGIEKKLSWLSKHPEPRLQDIPAGGTTSPTFAQTIWHGAFRWGTEN